MAECNRSVATCRHDSIRGVTVSVCKISSNELDGAEMGPTILHVALVGLVVLGGGT